MMSHRKKNDPKENSGKCERRKNRKKAEKTDSIKTISSVKQMANRKNMRADTRRNENNYIDIPSR